MILNSQIPEGRLEDKWSNYKQSQGLIAPSNRKNYKILVVGTGLAGASAAASLAELGFKVQAFTLHDSPRRAHSIAAQGGINASKNYTNDGDSVYRLFYDTIKGGDFRAREANVYRLAQISEQIIDQAVAQGVPFAREYGGLLKNRSFGGAQVSRTFYARGQTGQQLLLGAYGALMRQVNLGNVELHTHTEMMDLIVSHDRASGIVTRNIRTGELKTFFADAVLLATGGYGNIFYLSTNAMNSNVTAAWRCHKKGACFANPSFVQIHPTCIPRSEEGQSKLTLMSESLRNDGRVWLPLKKGDNRSPKDIPEKERDYYLERIYPAFGNLVPRDVASRQAKFQIEEGRGVGPFSESVYLDFQNAIQEQGQDKIKEKYGNLFSMYQRITGENPYEVPMKIYPAVHYTMGGLWVDYELQSSIEGLFVLGEANFSDHGANRLGASALMQGLADGYFIAPYTLQNFLAKKGRARPAVESVDLAKQQVQNQIDKLLQLKGKKTVDQIHRELGEVLWKEAGMIRQKQGLESALKEVRRLRESFWQEACLSGSKDLKNAELEKAGRLLDFLELGELLIQDALLREESCGCHFRKEFQTQDHEAQRDDKKFLYVSAWEWKEACQWELFQEPLVFDKVKMTSRSYK